MFDPILLLFCIIGTCIIFSWLLFNKESTARIFFSLFVAMYLVYSGIGLALDNVNESYVYYYFSFSICISLGIFWGLRQVKNSQNTLQVSWYNFFNRFLDRYSKRIIIVDFLVKIFPLIYPENRIVNLIHPPSPDVINMLVERFRGDGESQISAIISIFQSFLYPFYLLSLYKYGKKTLKLVMLVVAPYYMQYCDSAYLGRGSMLEALLIITLFTYFCRPEFKKKLIIVGLSFFPIMMVFFVQYSKVRIGGESFEISYMEAIGTLLEQESGYPKHFDAILGLQGQYFFKYLVWLFTLPFPGFVRGGMDVHFAAIFSENILGMYRWQKGFYILLPGVVGESVFLLGRQLFWLNGIIYGFLMGIMYKILTRYPQLLGILIVVMINFGYVINRVGLFGGLPFILKILVYFYLILLLLKKTTS